MTLSVILSPFYISGCSVTFPNGNCNFRGTKVWVFFIYFLPSSSLLADRAATFYHDRKWAHPLWQQSCWFSSQSYRSQKCSLWSNWEGWEQSRARRLQTPVLLLQFWPFFKIKCFSMCCLPSISLQGPKMVACWQFCPFFIPDFGGKDLLTFSCVIAGSLTSMAPIFFFHGPCVNLGW